MAFARWAFVALLTSVGCQSSSPYASPARTAAAVGMAAAGAGVSRATGGCLALCTNGTTCNSVTGLCEGPESLLRASPAPPPKRKRKRHASESVAESSSYEAEGHEYEVPALDGADAGCDPHAIGDGGAVACEMDGGTY